jgi:hypothetical protein
VIPFVEISSLYFWRLTQRADHLANVAQQSAPKNAAEIAAEIAAEVEAARKARPATGNAAEIEAEKRAKIEALRKALENKDSRNEDALIATRPPTLPPDFVINDSSLNFRYAPPPSLNDLTDLETKNSLHSTDTSREAKDLKVLLSVESSFDDSESGWYSIRIKSYPRKNLREYDDLAACRAFARCVVVGQGSGAEKRSEQYYGGFHFVVSESETDLLQNLRSASSADVRYFRVYTTIRTGQMLAFIFSANSLGVLDKVANSMKTLSAAHEH